MERARWARLDGLLDELLDDHDPTTLDARLAALCGDDEGLSGQLRRLLAAAHEGRDDVFERPLAASLPALVGDLERVLDESADDAAEPSPECGRTIDRYRLLGILGRGGMGVVYLAERADDQFEKQVALKLLPRGLETPDKERRFRLERQILARLEHPGIARLLDGGVTDEGYPYLVMERVEGEPIDRWCERRKLGVRGRLELFLSVCDAVQYAHSNLVVHRDLKPANILVTGAGEIKLLDFGIGKVLSDDEDDGGAPATRDQALTPDYASPEQLANRPVSAASDVYSLGVVAYRLLTGVTPARLGRSDPGGGRAPTHQRVPPPSEVAATGSAALTRWRRRATGRSDLDLIVLRALAAEPAARYPSVSALADDLRHFLEGRPVTARRATRWYRWRRFVARHRLATSVTASAAAVLVAGAMAVTWQARVAARERDRARVEAARAQRVAEFVGGLFNAANPTSEGAGQTSLHDLLDQGEVQLRSQLRSDPAVRGKLLEVLSNAHVALGDYSQATALAEESVADLRRAEPADWEALAAALTSLAWARIAAGDLEQVELVLAEAQGLYDATGVRASRGMALLARQRGVLRAQRGDDRGAATEHATALRMWHELGAEVEEATELTYLAGRIESLGQPERALELKREALATLRRSYGDTHPAVLNTRNNIAYSLHSRGDYRQAEVIYREVLQAVESLLGPDHPDVADPLNNLGKVLMDEGRFSEAAPYVRRAAAIRRRTLEPNQSRRIVAEMNLASLELALGATGEAVALYRSGLERFEHLAGLASLPAARCRSLLGIALHRAGEPSRALPLLTAALERQRAGGRPLDIADTLAGLGAVLTDLGRADEALPLLQEALDARLAALPADHWSIAEVRVELAGALVQLGRPARARDELVAGRRVLAALADHDWASARARRFAGEL